MEDARLDENTFMTCQKYFLKKCLQLHSTLQFIYCKYDLFFFMHFVILEHKCQKGIMIFSKHIP